ncbi:ATP-binding protein [Listeria welshimeri]|nr:ATP-binding protein [Listeria welshimeri]
MNSIGKVNYVSYDKLCFDITDFDKLEFNNNGSYYFSKGILDFVTIINNQNEKFIYQVERIEDTEKAISFNENSKFKYKANVICSPIGIIENNKINFNLKTYPFLQNKVYLTNKDEFNIIFNTKSDNPIYLGVINDQYSAKFDINKLLTFHSAVLGNTGSGKSTTIRQILTEIQNYDYENLNIHVFDVHDEYSKLNDVSVIDVLNDYQINLKDLELQDWINLVKPSDLVQLPILRMSLQLADTIANGSISEIWLRCFLAKTLYTHVQTDAIAKRTKILSLLEGTDIDVSNYSSQYANFTKDNEKIFLDAITQKMLSQHAQELEYSFLQKQITNSSYTALSFDELLKSLNYVFYLEECKGNSQARNHSNTLETRIKEIQSRYHKFFHSSKTNLEDKLVTIYNVSELDDDLLLFFSSYLCKKTFNENKQKELINREINVFILEEAHRYISRNKENSQLYELEIFKKIAREGRKFGCFLYLSSQRPSELSSTVLSQCNNYLLHRIKNNIDLEYMSKTIPYITTNQIKRLSFLPTGTTYSVGELFSIPIEINIPKPSKNIDVTSTPAIRLKEL